MWKGLAVFGCGLLAFALFIGPAFLPFGDYVYPDWLSMLMLVSPFLGAAVGGWLVSRRSTRGGKIGWILGGGLGIGFLSFLVTLTFVVWLISSAMDDIYGNGGYCC